MGLVDEQQILEDIRDEYNIDYRDPYEKPYNDPEKQTKTQKKVWNWKERGLFRYAIIGGKGAGKAQSLDEPVLTPDGYTRMGKIQTGDNVIGSDGTPTRVAAIHPQGEKQIYGVKFNDGTTVKTTGDHIWRVRTGGMKHKGKGFERLRTTTELWNDATTSQGYPKWEVPTVDPVEFPKKSLKIDPYIMGILIAEGSFTSTGVKFATKDREIVRRIRKQGWTVDNPKQDNVHWVIRPKGVGLHSINKALQEYGLNNKKSGDKFIPQDYRRTCVSDRLALLRGLMDGDGTVTRAKTASYSTVSRALAEDVADVIRSFGGKTEVRKRKTNQGRGYAYRVSANLDVNPFYLSRKTKKYNTDATQGDVKKITGFERLEKAPAKCITVTAEDGCYVTGGYTVTHNSFLGATFAMHYAQKYPQSTGCFVANSTRQVKDAVGDALGEVCDLLGYKLEYFRSKKIFGEEQSLVYTIDLDGKGLEQGATHLIYCRSLQSVENMEGTEIDYMVCDEIQDAYQGDLTTALSRNRGTEIIGEDSEKQNPLMLLGMTQSSSHWIYNLIEDRLGFIEEDQMNISEALPQGVILEPTLKENIKNVGQSTIDKYRQIYSPDEIERLVHAERVASNKNRVFSSYRDHLHRSGRMSRLLTGREPERRLYISLDFNVSPMSASVWQEKPWNDRWSDEDVVLKRNDDGLITQVQVIDLSTEEQVGASYRSLKDLAEPDREVLAQVGEFEVWPDNDLGGGTDGIMKNIRQEYADHPSEIVILGDARGDQRSAQSMTSNWDVVRDHAVPEKLGAQVIPGVMSDDGVFGKVKYNNPPKQDSINLVNRTLLNGEKRVQMCFLPESDLQSGGVAASMSALSYKPNGTIDESNDKREDRSVRRSHFADTVRYMVWFWKDGGRMDAGTYSQMADSLEDNQQADSPNLAPESYQEGSDSGATIGNPSGGGGFF